jgi:hypothetical protein
MTFSKKQYRRRVVFSKALSALALVALILWIGYVIFWNEEKISQEKHPDKEVARHAVSIVDSIFEGSDKNGKDYKVASESVLKTGVNLYDLEVIAGHYDLGSMGIEMKANFGKMDDGKKLLKLIDDVVIEYSGYLLKTTQMDVDLTKMAAKNDREVSILYRHSNIRADRFSADTDANIVHFEGHVVTHFKVSDF